MATKFIKGQEVKLLAVVPQGPVQALRMDEDGNFFYLLDWVDANGDSQSRWFAESDLEAV
ncbi:hypothetical protein UFOVP1295_64 [uncultured Caudovirales phage]|uniref:Uncharacterized protein n=1 Tax=uncultured Caudovirales phage TaxID=2100421 RepID=A0A6J5RPL3_9CAUD|nr:hypothetical protein UFOVP1295_64 [uncultured Caudovirales phage]